MFRLLAFICLILPYSAAVADDWPQWLGPHRDGHWTESGILRRFEAAGPSVGWRANVAGGYAGPAVANGRVFVTDYVVSAGDTAPNPDERNVLEGTERMLCLDERTGQQVWEYRYPRSYKISYPAGPRATPTVDGDHVYGLGAEGDLYCLRVSNGEAVWARNLPDDFHCESPMWGYASHPLIVGDLVICLAGGEGSAVVALDKGTGKERWRALSTSGIGYAPPTLMEANGRAQLLVFHAQALSNLDPATGQLLWSQPLEPDYGMAIAPPLKAGNLLFVGAIKDKSLGLRLHEDRPGADVIWRGKNNVGIGPSHCPMVADPQSSDYIYGVDRGGQLVCIRAGTGERLWENYSLMASKRFSNAGTAFITRNEDVYFILSETAELVIARLSPEGYHEVSRSKPLLEPTHDAFGRAVLWSPPAFANGAIFVRNDKEVIRVSLRR